MAKIGSLEHVVRRLRFRDLQVFFSVMQSRSMAKSAAQLGITQPAVSDIVAGLEHMFAARLFDRTSRGVEPTRYGHALLVRAKVVFDELNHGIRDIEYLSDPTTGEVRIGCPGSIAAALLSAAIERFSRQYPRVVLHLDEVGGPSTDFPTLRERKHDFVVARIAQPLIDEADLNVELLFQDPLVIVAHADSLWARRRKIDPAELTDASWILTAPEGWVYVSVAEAFQARGLSMPKIHLAAPSALLRLELLARAPFVTALPSSLLRLHAGWRSLKVLPVDLKIRGYPVAILTLKNRVLSSVVALFIEHIREIAKTIGERPQAARL